MKERLLLPILLCLYSTLPAQNGVFTQHNDLNRTGWNAKETILNHTNVKPGSFGKLFIRTVDDQQYAQPLVALHLAMPGKGTRNVVFVATVNNSVYAFDADSANEVAPFWQVNLTPAGSRVIRHTDMTGACGGFYNDFSGNIGIVGTPVIDTATGTLYVVARSLVTSNNTYQQYLHALDITTGNEQPNSPRLITAQINGTGDGSVGGVVHFDPQKANQRPGLLLLNGVIYIAFSSHCDWGPYHGWVLGYDKTSLQQVRVYNSTPDGYNGGIWMSGAAPAADEAGNIYLAVGNGSVGKNNDPTNLINRSESALKLVPNGPGLTVASYFTPNNFPDLEAGDVDFGVTEVLLIPNTTRAMTACKDGRIYVLDRDNMGGYNASTNQAAQTINLGSNAHLRSSLAYYKGSLKEYVYSWSENALLSAFPFDRSTNLFDLPNTIYSGAQGPIGNNGALLAVSSNGSADSTAVLWATYAANGDANQSVRPGILRAFDATDVTHELWNSGVYTADNPGNYAKFNCPTVINGKVYLATFSNQLVVYGLTGVSADSCSNVNIALNKTVTASSVDGAFNAANAVDGNAATRWSSAFSDPQWISIDFGRRYDFCNIHLLWEAAFARDFKIQVSEDNLSWTTVINISGNASPENYLPVNTSGRYVRMLGTTRATPYGYSLWEFEVFGKESNSNCASPGGLASSSVYESSATLSWNRNGASNFILQYKTVTAGNWETVATDTNEVALAGLACGTAYLYRVQGICSGDSGNFSTSASFSTLECNSNCGPLPTRWSTIDIGDVGVAGSACYANNTFTLNASGTDIWDVSDAFRFAFKTLVGDGEIKARVLSLDQTDPWNKCGIMVRESLTPGSKHAFIAVTTGNGIAFQDRATTDDVSYNVNTGTGTAMAPHWLKLVKAGSTYSGYRSNDGNTWVQVGNAIDLGFGNGTPVYIGLALTSHNNYTLSTATIDNYSLAGVVSVTLQEFTGSLNLNKQVELHWTTTLEVNIHNFVIERSADNNHFVDIDTIAAANSGRFTVNYQRQDDNPLPGLNYYRLRITDNDGKITYSSLVVIRVTDSKAPLVYPNPAQQMVNVAAGTDPIRLINLYDVSGKRVKSVSNSGGSGVVQIQTGNMAGGVYIVEIRTVSGVYKSKLLIR